jgi:hypothetical protein
VGNEEARDDIAVLMLHRLECAEAGGRRQGHAASSA